MGKFWKRSDLKQSEMASKTFFLTSAGALGFTLAILVLNSCGPRAADSQQPGDETELESSHEHYPYPNFRGSDVHGDHNFATLINNFQEGRPANAAWAGAWWSYKRQNGWGNGIASNVIHSEPGTPAGLYDAAHCGKTHAQDWEVKNHGDGVKNAEGWWGHCNGWSTAAALFPEPREGVKVNGINFSVADIKAVLTEASMLSSIDFFGTRMEKNMGTDSLEYSDIVPDMYFLVLTNFMGKLKQGVLLDQDTGPAVWNQPIAGYRFEYPTPADVLPQDPKNPNVYRVMVRSQVWWASDNVSDPGILTPEFQFQTDPGIFDSRKYKAEIWLDAPLVFNDQGRIVSSGNVIVTRIDDKHHIGGAWKMEEFLGQPGYDWEHLWPDYMWVPYQLQYAKDFPDNEKEGYANPYIDIDWIKEHLLVPGGKNDADYNGKPCPIPSAPPSPSPSPSVSPSPSPSPTPAATPSARPSVAPAPTPNAVGPHPVF
jgi:hypothetical protein